MTFEIPASNETTTVHASNGLATGALATAIPAAVVAVASWLKDNNVLSGGNNMTNMLPGLVSGLASGAIASNVRPQAQAISSDSTLFQLLWNEVFQDKNPLNNATYQAQQAEDRAFKRYQDERDYAQTLTDKIEDRDKTIADQNLKLAISEAKNEMHLADDAIKSDINAKYLDLRDRIEGVKDDSVANLNAAERRIDARFAAQEAYNATNNMAVKAVSDQSNQLAAIINNITKTVVPNSAICPGWGQTVTLPAQSTCPCNANNNI